MRKNVGGGITPIKWDQDSLLLLDQRFLPHAEKWVQISNIEDCFSAIKDMVVRGAPCIGFTAVFGMGLWAKNNSSRALDEFKQAANYLKSARPTAVNLEFEINRCELIARNLWDTGKWSCLYEKLIEFGLQQMKISEENHFKMCLMAEKELHELFGNRPLRLMTHCNTGYLACGHLGTALGVIQYLHGKGKVANVWVDETRPYMQGSRLTSYELSKLEIPHQIVVEGAASYLMREKHVDAIFVGADRIVKNGDTANKIGTSTLAIVANYYGIPFYVVAPTSSFDLSIETGAQIEIELRPPKEILEFSGVKLAMEKASALNPSFDITEGSQIRGIFCENGMIRPESRESWKEVFKEAFKDD